MLAARDWESDVFAQEGCVPLVLSAHMGGTYRNAAVPLGRVGAQQVNTPHTLSPRGRWGAKKTPQCLALILHGESVATASELL